MKNGELVSGWLNRWDEVPSTPTETEEEFNAWCEAVNRATTAWQACLGDGWAPEELDEAYIRRTGLGESKAEALRSWRKRVRAQAPRSTI